MALNLSTLTSPANSSVLEEVNTTADFLESVPVFRNLSRSSNRGSDAKQDVALNQPKALPLINGDGYLYLSGVNGNNAQIADSDSLSVLNDIEIIANFKVVDDSTWRTLVSKYSSTSKEYLLTVSNNSAIQFYRGGGGSSAVYVNFNTSYDDLKPWIKATHRLSDGQCQLFFSDDGVTWSLFDTLTMSAVTPANGTTDVFLGGFGATGQSDVCRGAIKRAIVKDGINGTPVLDVDFTATSVRHGATKFKCATGQVVTINKSGNDPATIIKKPVLRFANKSDDSTNIALSGLLNQTITDGYMFAAFSVLGDGGEASGRMFSVNPAGSQDYVDGFIFVYHSNLKHESYYSGGMLTHQSMFKDARKDILSEVRIESGNHLGKVNNAGLVTSGTTGTKSGDEFNICQNEDNSRLFGENASIDLEYLALFPATITDAQADSVRNYINNRNNVFDLKDGFGYYFYDAQNAPVGNITDVDTWSGRIVGSDNGDSASIVAQQATANDQPVGDGYVVTFADNTDHLEIPQVTLAAGDSYAWMVCGTSLGTFAYKVTVSGETELNLLGHLGVATYRQAGDLFGIILLPESATGADIEAARKLLIDRGAADGVTGSSVFAAWYQRSDIVSFKSIEFSSVTDVSAAWRDTSLVSFDLQLPNVQNASRSWQDCQSLTNFSSELPSLTSANKAFIGCAALSDFRTTDIKNCTDFTSAWQSCSALSSFPAGAKLGTEANNVNFTSAWQSSGLTSFPSDIDLSNGVTFLATWNNTNISSFPLLNLNKGREFALAWRNNSLLTDWPAGFFDNWNPSSIASGVFNDTWDGCVALSAISVENILVSINNSGKYGTATGAAGGGSIDSGIDIDYNGDPLSAATNAAVDSLKAKGWSIIVNNVTL